MFVLLFADAEDGQALCLTNYPRDYHCISNDSRAVPCTPDPVLFAVVCSLISAGTKGHFKFYL